MLAAALGGIMNISVLTQFADRLFSGDSNSSQNVSQAQAPARHHNHYHEQGADNSGSVDRYTPSSSSQDVASFQFEQLRFSAFSVAPLPSSSAPVNSTASAASAAGAATVPANATTPAAVTAPIDAISPATTTAAAPVSGTSAASPAAQDPLQALNAELSALGLSQSEIQAFDQVAGLIQQFSPVAFQDLQNQINTLASQFAAAAQSPSTSTTNSSPGFQLTELSLRFSGLNETLAPQGQASNGGSSTVEVSAFNLQIKEVTVSLTSPDGQNVQLQSPPPVSVPGTTAGPTTSAATSTSA